LVSLEWNQVGAEIMQLLGAETALLIDNGGAVMMGFDCEMILLFPAVFKVDVGNEVFAAFLIRIEAVGETVEGSDRQICTLVSVSV